MPQSDLENNVQAGERTIYRIGSITKQFTAAAILRLNEQRRLSLDDRIGGFFSALSVDAREVSIRELLNGIRSFTAMPALRQRNVSTSATTISSTSSRRSR